jgi:hypothetical protein
VRDTSFNQSCACSCGESRFVVSGVPRARVFYHRSVKDETDDVPKVSGYWPSELAVTKWVLGSLL